MLKRLKALAVAAVLGSGLGVAVGLLMILSDPSLDLPIQYHLSVLSNFARIGGLAGLAFAQKWFFEKYMEKLNQRMRVVS